MFSFPLVYDVPSNVWFCNDLAVVVGLPIPGAEEFGAVEQIVLNSTRGGIIIGVAGVMTEKPCPNESREGYHIIQATEARYPVGECHNCDLRVAAWPKPHTWLPAITLHDGQTFADAVKPQEPGGAFGFPSQMDAIAAAAQYKHFVRERIGEGPYVVMLVPAARISPAFEIVSHQDALERLPDVPDEEIRPDFEAAFSEYWRAQTDPKAIATHKDWLEQIRRRV